jgi:hypothetical protein
MYFIAGPGLLRRSRFRLPNKPPRRYNFQQPPREERLALSHEPLSSFAKEIRRYLPVFTY